MADNPTTTSVVRIYRFPALPKAMLARISAGRYGIGARGRAEEPPARK